jgi:uncharacterized membrane protein YdcZ (DUF606 family)
MIHFAWTLPLFLGAISVFQAGLNETMISKIGFSLTMVCNSVVLLGLSLLFVTLFQQNPAFLPKEFHAPSSEFTWNWWYLLPGLLGFFLVAGIPISFAANGSAKTMILLVAFQILTGILWDYFYREAEFSKRQIFGAGLALLGAVLTISDS